MNVWALLLAFVFGLAVGSFLNVLIVRLHSGESLGGRSRCFSCLAKLAWYDLVPLVSYFQIRGRCRYCRSKLSIQYPLVELASSLIFLVIAFLINPTIEPTRYILVVSFFIILLAISVYDIRHKIIPDSLSFALFIAALLFEFAAVGASREALPDFLTALALFSFFAGIWLISRGAWMGFGDAKLAFSIGLFLGSPAAILAVFFAFWIGAFFGIFMLLRKKYSAKTEVPFAPFLALGALVAFLLVTTNALSWYYTYVTII